MQVQERVKTGEENLCVLCMFLNVMKMWALFFLPCMYVWNTCEMIYGMRYELIHVYECMPRYKMYVWYMKEIWLCMVMKCMHESWNKITVMSSSMNDQWKCRAYDCMKEIWICMIMKCMHDSWIEITTMSSSVNDQWKCMAYDFMKRSVNCYLATVVGGIVLGTYHWGCR